MKNEKIRLLGALAALKAIHPDAAPVFDSLAAWANGEDSIDPATVLAIITAVIQALSLLASSGGLSAVITQINTVLAALGLPAIPVLTPA